MRIYNFSVLILVSLTLCTIIAIHFLGLTVLFACSAEAFRTELISYHCLIEVMKLSPLPPNLPFVTRH